MTITLDGLVFDIDDLTESDGLGHTQIMPATTGLVSGLAYPEEALFPNRIMRAMLSQIGLAAATTSATSHDISTGSKTFTLAAAVNIAKGAFVIFSQTSNPANFIFGQVTAIAGTSLTGNFTVTGGTGTGITAWTVTLSGARGATGAAGTNGTNGLGVPTPTASGFGQIPVQNTTDDGYQFLAQGADGQVLESKGADALPVWTTPVYVDSASIDGTLTATDYVIGLINKTCTLTQASIIAGAGTGTIALYLSPDRTSAGGTAITGGSFSASTTVATQSLTSNNTITAGTPRYLIAKITSPSGLQNACVEASYTKKVSA